MAKGYVAKHRIRTQSSDKDGTKLQFAPGDEVKGVKKHLMDELIELGAVEEKGSEPEPEPEPELVQPDTASQ